MDGEQMKPASVGTNLNWRSKLTYRFLSKIMPKRTKRMVFMACIFVQIVETDSPSHETLLKLNKMLNLSRDEEAMRFPIIIRHTIWKSLDDPILVENGRSITLHDAMTSNDNNIINKAIAAIIERAPSWIVYDSAMVISNELKYLQQKLCTSMNEFAVPA